MASDTALAKQVADLQRELDAVRRRLANLPVRFPSPSEPTPAVRLGRVVCGGPCGESDFVDNRYWVQVCRIANTDTDPSSPLTLTDVPDVPGNCGSGVGDTSRIVCVTNLGEANLQTHLVRPGTPVVIFAQRDSGNPGTTRYFAADMDLEDTGESCDSSSGSSSSGGSSSSSGSTSGGSSSSSGSTSGGGSSSSGGTSGCGCPTKQITFIDDITAIECNSDGTITATWSEQTVTVYGP